MDLFSFNKPKPKPRTNYTAVERPVRNTFDADIVIPANAQKGQAVNLTIYTDPENPSLTSTSLKAVSDEV